MSVEFDCESFFSCANEAALDKLAAALAEHVCANDVIALNGDLGAGKTRFVQGVARALGINAEVTSPTFTIHAVYPGALELNHFDLYRLEDETELEDIGYWDALEGGGVSFVEWAERIDTSMPDDHMAIHISVEPDGTRLLHAQAQGPRAQHLLGAWQTTVRS